MTGDEYSIQDAIDNAGDVDTIVVHQGVYEENLLIDKSITLTSLALFDPTTNTIAETLDDWVDLDQYIVTNDDINFTVIDGSGKLQSTITIATEEDICIEPIILGFTIQDGAGTLVERYYDSDGGDYILEQYIGGGVLSYLANPTLHYNKIQNNGIEAHCSENWEVLITKIECELNGFTWLNGTKTGSGIYPVSSSDDIGFLDRTKTSDRDCGNDTYDFTYNFFENNYSSLGRHIGNRYFEGDFDLSNCVFDYWNCQDEGAYQTPIWVNIDDIDNLVAENEENSDSGCLYFGGNVYVDPVSGNDDLNDGLSWEGAFYTITHAIASVVGTEQNPVDIHLAEGVYSPSTNGEIYPIEMISYVNLIGLGEEVTLLDAEQTGRVIIIDNCGSIFQSNIISDLTITGGYSAGAVFNYGGGIYVEDSNQKMRDITIRDNYSQSFGGGIDLESSVVDLQSVKIINNIAIKGAGGINSYASNLVMKNTTINGNISGNWGGGMGIAFGDATIENCTISNNYASQSGGSIDIYYSYPTIITNSIIWNNIPAYFNLYNSTLDIAYSDIENGWEGTGNIDVDPLFTDPENGDFTLQEGSPCIDAGTADLDGDGYEDIEYCGEAPDMGAFEYITEDCEECPDSIEGDTNFDGLVNILDIVIVVNCILSDSCDICFDLNADSELNILDIVLIVNIILNP